jgi:hypothetical protein
LKINHIFVRKNKVMNRTDLALKLFNPNVNGVSRWVCRDECVGEYAPLMPTNGNMWYRNPGLAGKKYIWETKQEDGKLYWRFNGFKVIEESRLIRSDLRKELMVETPYCAHTGFGDTVNDRLIIDHRNGRYDEPKVLSLSTQEKKDLQVLSNRSNLEKRSACLECKLTGLRFDAKKLGYSKSVCSGSIKYEGSCVGCYWYGPREFKATV